MSNRQTTPTYLLNASEEMLASYQQDQGRSNNCAEFSAAAALGLLFDRRIDGMELAGLADRGWLRQGLRTWPGGPTAPGQQARLVREYARLYGLDVDVEARTASAPDLRRWLDTPDLACLVTVAWDNRYPLKMRKGIVEVKAAKSPFFWSGHTMLLAAWDPANGDRNPHARWGFVNSWGAASAAPGLYWMNDGEFLRAWSYSLFPIGSHNVVVLGRQKA